MYVYGQLKNAQLENTAIDLAVAPIGRLWFNSTANQMKISDGTNAINILANDGHCVFGRSATASENIRLHKGAASVLQFVAGDDVTAEDTLSAALGSLSFKHENYIAASLPAAGNKGRVVWNDTTGKLNVDNGSTWDSVETGNAVNIVPMVLKETLVSGDLVHRVNDAGTAKIQKMDGLDPITLKAGVDFEAGGTTYISTCYDTTNDKLLIAYVDTGDSNKGKVIVGSFDADNVVSFGTPVVFNNATTSFVKIVYNATNSKFVIAFRDGGNSNYGTAIAGEVSGTSVNLGSEYVFKSAATHSIQMVYSNGYFYMTYGVDANTTTLFGRAGSASGALVITYGPETSKACTSISDNRNLVASILQNKAVAFYTDSSVKYSLDIGLNGLVMDMTSTSNSTADRQDSIFEDPDYSKIFGVSVGLSDTKFGELSKFTYAHTIAALAGIIVCAPDIKRKIALVGLANDNSIRIVDYGNGYANSSFYTASTVFTGTMSGAYFSMIRIPARDIFILAFANSASAEKGVCIVGSLATYSDAIGIVQSGGNAGDTRNVAIEGGISTVHSGLTIGAPYYIQSNGSLGITKTQYPIGRALSATELLVTKHP